MSQGTVSRAKPLSEPVRSAITRLIKTVGERRVVEALQVSRHTLGRLAGGLPVQHATVALVEARLAALRAEGAS